MMYMPLPPIIDSNNDDDTDDSSSLSADSDTESNT